MVTSAQTGAATRKKATKSAPATPTSKPKTTKPAARTARGNGAAKTRRINPDQRRNYIEVAAYYIAERRGFSGGHEAEDWVTAEIEIDRLLSEGKLSA